MQYSDMYIHEKIGPTITGVKANAKARKFDERHKLVISKYYALTDAEKDLTVKMRMYNVIECSKNYSTASRSLLQYYKDVPNDFMTKSELICNRKNSCLWQY